MRKIGHILIILILVLSGFVLELSIAPIKVSAYTPHDPIYIKGDVDFATQAATEGWRGDGTKETPYIIEGYEIDTSSAHGIEINSTTVYFIIRDSWISNLFAEDNLFHGIVFQNVTNGIITNCSIENNLDGISVYLSYGNTIINNNISNNWWGISLDHSNRNSITANTLYSNYHAGIDLWSSVNENITGNIMIENGIFIWGSSIENWNSHNIDLSNTVNSKPVYYWKNQIGETVLSDPGQIILANCSNVRIEEQNIYDGTAGILIGFSSNNNIINNNISNNVYGRYLYSSHSNNITNNTAFNNICGIKLVFSHRNNIEYNNLIENSYGLYLDGGSSENNIAHNFAKLNNCGIFSSISFKNNITRNDIHFSDRDGIELLYSDENNVIANNISNTNWSAIEILSSDKNIIEDNVVSYNKEGMYIDSSRENLIINNMMSNNVAGIYVFEATYNNITDNNFSSNTHAGIKVWWSEDNYFTKNNVQNNDMGIKLYGSTNNSFTYNTIISNDNCGIYIGDSNNNIFHHNNLNNQYQLNQYDSSSNTWDDGIGGGNYWSDYDGIDGDDDGIGDTKIPHHDVDNYPLMEPVGVVGSDEDSSKDVFSLYLFPLVIIFIILPICWIIIIIVLRRPKKQKPIKIPPETESQESPSNQPKF
jgi:parallel beta-helix repeat protein